MDPFTIAAAAMAIGGAVDSFLGKKKAKRKAKKAISRERGRIAELKRQAMIGQQEANAVGGMQGQVAQRRLENTARGYDEASRAATGQYNAFVEQQHRDLINQFIGTGANLATGLGALYGQQQPTPSARSAALMKAKQGLQSTRGVM